MIRHTDIPPATPGEVISRAFLDQLVNGANTGRVVTGDDSISPTTVGGALGLSVNWPANRDRGVLVQVLPGGLDLQELPLPGAIYGGQLYSQKVITVPDPKAKAGTRYTTATVNAAPNSLTCYVLNCAEFDTNSHIVTKKTTLLGRVVGAFRGRPLVAVNLYIAGAISGKVTGNAAGNGKYTGKSFTDVTADVSASGNLAESDFGTLAGSNDCLVLNPVELGVSNTGHDVTAATNTAQFAIYFTGRLVRINSDGTKVVHAMLFWAGC